MYLQMSPVALVVAVLLLGCAGHFDACLLAYPITVWLAMGTVNTLLQRLRPELLAERMKPPSDRDRASRLVAVPLILLHYGLAGFDARYAWSALPLAAQAAGLALVLLALALVGWTLLSNPYASSAVRIQEERGQEVISTGPYAFVRHPMYLSVLLFALGSPIALGSWWSALPLLPVLAVFVRRTVKEDTMLQEELPGYAAYALKVRHRVVPWGF